MYIVRAARVCARAGSGAAAIEEASMGGAHIVRRRDLPLALPLQPELAAAHLVCVSPEGWHEMATSVPSRAPPSPATPPSRAHAVPPAVRELMLPYRIHARRSQTCPTAHPPRAPSRARGGSACLPSRPPSLGAAISGRLALHRAGEPPLSHCLSLSNHPPLHLGNVFRLPRRVLRQKTGARARAEPAVSRCIRATPGGVGWGLVRAASGALQND